MRPRAVRNVSPAASGASASKPRGCQLQSVSVFNTDHQDQPQVIEFTTRVQIGPTIMSTMSSCTLIRA